MIIIIITKTTTEENMMDNKAYLICSYVRASLQVFIFCLNIYTIYYFISMTQFFINNIIGNDKKRVRKFKLKIIVILLIIGMALFDDNSFTIAFFYFVLLNKLKKEDVIE